ncbi:uncharacterized protein LOC127709379 [Mytilus californianus]|uniref:uncharacterized protein LOC127709379 n=1 Tax=Mytilus californianus TaxID=6549 RepID=UPI002247CF4E|nr:uncharacterized protein LOC127709379 [Mytilus californianus]XP_052070841.1 uncharacterized protein LOC127709379 [Mytilus californianus]
MGRKLEKRKQTEDEGDIKIKKEKINIDDSRKDECSLEKGNCKKTTEDIIVNNCRNDSDENSSVKSKKKHLKETVVIDKDINNDIPLMDAKDNVLNEETQTVTTESKIKVEKNRENDKNENTLDITNKDVEDIMKEVSVNKKKKKKEKNKKTELCITDSIKTETEENKKSPKELAIAYLKLWKKNRDEWKFQKVRQVWLLSNMLDSEMIKDKHFKTLLLYLDGLKGKARETTSLAAQKIIESDSDSGVKVDRARQIVQQLSTE